MKGKINIDVDTDRENIVLVQGEDNMNHNEYLVMQCLGLVTTILECEQSGIFKQGDAMSSAIKILQENYVNPGLVITTKVHEKTD